MAYRRGMGKGKGKGYYNLLKKDKKVHSDSAKGKKQPQKTKGVSRKSDEYFHEIRMNFRRYFRNFMKTETFENLPEKEKKKIQELENEISNITNRYAFDNFVRKHKKEMYGAIMMGFMVTPITPLNILIALGANVNIGKALLKDFDDYFKNYDSYMKSLNKELPDVPDYEIEKLAGNLAILDMYKGVEPTKTIEEEDIERWLEEKGQSKKILETVKNKIKKENMDKEDKKQKVPQPVGSPDTS